MFVRTIIFLSGGVDLTMYYAREDQIAAATKIQAAYRGYIVRRTQPLKHLRTIRNVRTELNRLETQLARDPQLFEILRRDPAERLKWSEGGMALLLQLDSMQGVHPVVRENRKSLTREVISYQEYIDSAGKGQKDVTNGRGEGRTGSGQHGGHTQAHLPYVQTAHGQQGMDSSSGLPISAHSIKDHFKFSTRERTLIALPKMEKAGRGEQIRLS